MLPTIIHRAPSRRRGDFDFDRLFNGLLDLDRSSRSMAAADLYETEEGYGLELELPGFQGGRDRRDRGSGRTHDLGGAFGGGR